MPIPLMASASSFQDRESIQLLLFSFFSATPLHRNSRVERLLTADFQRKRIVLERWATRKGSLGVSVWLNLQGLMGADGPIV